MTTEHRILLNTLALAGGHGVAQLANLAFVVWFARAFGPDTFGAYSFAMAVGAVLATFVSFGTNSLATKEVARDRGSDRELIGHLMPMQWLAGGVVMIAVGATGALASASGVGFAFVVLLGLHHVLLRWTALAGARFRGRELMGYVAGGEGLRSLLILVLGGLVIWLLRDPVVAVAVAPAAGALTYAAIWIAGRHHYGRLALALRSSRVRELARAARPYLAIMLIDVLYQRLGILLLSTLATPAAVGRFASAERLVMSLSILYAMFVGAVFPALSRLAVQDPGAMDQLAQRCLRVLLVVTLPATALLHLFSEDVVRILFGTEYAGAATVLEVVAGVLALRGLNSFFGALAMAVNAQGLLPRLRFMALAVFATLSCLLIGSWNELGVAYALLASETFLLVSTCIALRSRIRFPWVSGAAWPPAAACVVAGLLDHLLMADATLGFRVVALPGVLAAAMAALGAVRVHDLRFLLRIAAREDMA